MKPGNSVSRQTQCPLFKGGAILEYGAVQHAVTMRVFCKVS
jgi:hypothetical protein